MHTQNSSLPVSPLTPKLSPLLKAEFWRAFPKNIKLGMSQEESGERKGEKKKVGKAANNFGMFFLSTWRRVL